MAGLQKHKAPIIWSIALEELKDKRVSRSLTSSFEEGRRTIMSIRGIGEKTADVFLMLYANAPVVPVDVHVKRVSQRLGITSSGTYDAVQKDIHALVSPELRRSTHLAMIRFGREVCRARSPKCKSCPLNSVCKWYKSNKTSG